MTLREGIGTPPGVTSLEACGAPTPPYVMRDEKEGDRLPELACDPICRMVCVSPADDVANPYPEGVIESVPIRVRCVRDSHVGRLGEGEVRFAFPEDGLYRIYDLDDGKSHGYRPEDFEVLEVCGTPPRGGVAVSLDGMQRGLLADLGLPTALSTDMGDDAWCDVMETLKDEVQMRGLNDAHDGENEHGLLCSSVYMAMIRAEEVADEL